MSYITVRLLTYMTTALSQAWRIGIWRVTWHSERLAKHLVVNARKSKVWFFIAIRAARTHRRRSPTFARNMTWRKAWARLDARMIMPLWSAISIRWRTKKFIFMSIEMGNLSIAQWSILLVPHTTMYDRILITAIVRHSKRDIRRKFIGHSCYKNAWLQQYYNFTVSQYLPMLFVVSSGVAW